MDGWGEGWTDGWTDEQMELRKSERERKEPQTVKKERIQKICKC